MGNNLTSLDRALLVEWGTYGPGALEAFDKEGTPLPPIAYKKLGEMDTDHLGKLLIHLEGSGQETDLMQIAVVLVLEDRNNNNRREAILSQQERNRSKVIDGDSE